MNLFHFWKHKYETNETLFNDLLLEKSEAFSYVVEKALPQIQMLCKNNRLSKEDAEDILADSIMLLIQRMRDGMYKFQGYSPITYLMRVANFLILNRLKTRGRETSIELHPDLDLSDDDLIRFFDTKEKIERLRSIINTHLGEPCAKLIWLKHFEEKTDEEVITEELTHFKTIQALRNARSRCMIRVRELLEKYNITRLKL